MTRCLYCDRPVSIGEVHRCSRKPERAFVRQAREVAAERSTLPALDRIPYAVRLDVGFAMLRRFDSEGQG